MKVKTEKNMSERAYLKTSSGERPSVSGDEEQGYQTNSMNDSPINVNPEEAKKRREQLFSRLLYAVLALTITGVITTVIVVLILTYEEKQVKRNIQFNDIFNGTFSTQGVSSVWSSNPSKENFMYYWKSRSAQTRENILRSAFENGIRVHSVLGNASTGCDIVKFDASSKSEQTLVSYESLTAANIPCNTNFFTHANERFVAFELAIEHVWRHSSLSRFVVLDVTTGALTDLSPSSTKQSVMKWCSPTSTAASTDAIAAFVQENNIYMHTFDSTTGKSKSVNQITTDGANELIFNGISDWVYEEEVIAGVDTFFFSPDCAKVLYLKLNDSQVPLIQLPDYVMDKTNPEYLKVRIPTPGDHNPIPSVHVYDLSSGNTAQVEIGQIPEPVNIEDENYVYDLMWASDSQFAVVRVNRYQNQKDILLGDVTKQTNGVISTTIVQTVKTDRWIQYAQGSTYFIPETTNFVDIVPFHDHFHIALYDYSKADTFVRYLTSGDFDVTQIYRKYSQTTKTVYYQSTMDSNGIQRHVFSVDLAGLNTVWLSVNHTAPTGNTTEYQQGHYDASFSAGGNYLVMLYNGPQFPFAKLNTIQALIKGEAGYTMSDNSALQKKLQNEVFMPKSVASQIENDNGDKLNVLLVYPPHFNAENEITYPTIIYSYNGPGSQLVNYDWHSMHNSYSLYLASLGFIVATVDGRGTGFRGVNFMSQTYKNLGYYEVLDQISVGKHLSSLKYVDSSRIAIWGWSYGGYLSSKTITFFENSTNSEALPFALALSVAPVTDWIYYDTAYTERYMLWPAVNAAGYKRSSVLNQVKEPKCPILPTPLDNGDVQQSSKKFVLAFGSRDDNVHPINSFNLMHLLQDSLVQFDLMVYTNKDHSIDNRRHIYRYLTQHLLQHLKL